MARNPSWSKDEIMLALDLYLRAGRKQLDADDPEVVKLSEVLQNLPIHPPSSRLPTFRNPNGVSMKLGNFRRIDPTYAGAGLPAGNKLEESVWDEFADDPERLHALTQAIRESAEEGGPGPVLEYDDSGEEEEFPEGRVLTRLHKVRERNPSATRRKKNAVLRDTGALACEVCGFDFAERYGELGEGFAECHHRLPVSELRPGQKTKLADLAIVCANCHRMIHRSRSLLTVEELQQRLA